MSRLQDITQHAAPLSQDDEAILLRLMKQVVPLDVQYSKADGSQDQAVYDGSNGNFFHEELLDALTNGWTVQIGIHDDETEFTENDKTLVIRPRTPTPPSPCLPPVVVLDNDFASAMRRIVALAATDPVLHTNELDRLERTWGETRATLWLLEALHADARSAQNVTRYMTTSTRYHRATPDLLTPCARDLDASVLLDELLAGNEAIRNRLPLIEYVMQRLGDVASERMIAYCEQHENEQPTDYYHGRDSLSSLLRSLLTDRATTDPRVAKIILQGPLTIALIRRIAQQRIMIGIPRLAAALRDWNHELQRAAIDALIELEQADVLLEWLNDPQSQDRYGNSSSIALKWLLQVTDDMGPLASAMNVRSQDVTILQAALEADHLKTLPLLEQGAAQTNEAGRDLGKLIALHGLSRHERLTPPEVDWLLERLDLSKAYPDDMQMNIALALVNSGAAGILPLTRRMATVRLDRRETLNEWSVKLMSNWLYKMPPRRQHLWAFMEALAEQARDAFVNKNEASFTMLITLIGKLPHPACLKPLLDAVAKGKKRNGNFNAVLKECETAKG